MIQDALPFLVWLLEATWLGLFVAGAWRTFAKAGAPGWAALVPGWNAVVLARLAGRRAWPWAALLLVPGVNVVAIVPVSIDLARRFGRGAAFGVGLAWLAPVFYPLLGLGAAQVAAPAPAVTR